MNTKITHRFKSLTILFSLFLLPLAGIAQEDETIRRPAQISFITPIGTNGLESGRCINNLSYNFIWGLSAGVHGVEAGGVGNSVRGNVRGLQVAGIFNTVGGDVTGIQASGLINVVGGHVTGIQIADFGNFTRGEVNGLQLSGFMNVAGDLRFIQAAGFMNSADRLRGIQLGGFMNTADDATGVQIAGFMNTADKMLGFQHGGFMSIADDVLGAQASGFMNVSDELKGVQVGGFMNVSGDMRGVQVAGFMNVADEVRGVQASGFMNIAGKLKGVQLGFLNIVDTVDGGVPIGLLSIVKNGGYRAWELGSSESWTGMLAFKSGINPFYSIWAIGTQFHQKAFYWGYGLGFGSRFRLSDYMTVNAEAIAWQLLENTLIIDDMDLLATARITVEGRIAGDVSWFAGPTFNYMISAYEYPDEETIYDHFAPWTLKSTVSGISRTRMWPGITAGIRF